MYKLLSMKHRTFNTRFSACTKSTNPSPFIKVNRSPRCFSSRKVNFKAKVGLYFEEKIFLGKKKSHEYVFFWWHWALEACIFFTFIKPAHYSKSGRKNQSGMEVAKWFWEMQLDTLEKYGQRRYGLGKKSWPIIRHLWSSQLEKVILNETLVITLYIIKYFNYD